MDRNQIIGWILIVGIVIGFVAYNSSQVEDLPQENTTQNNGIDSTKNEPVELAQPQAPKSTIQLDSNSTKEDSIKAQLINEQLVAEFGIFANSANLTGEEIILENNKIKLFVNTKGAYVSKTILKEFRSYSDYAQNQDGELTLFEGEGNEQIIEFKHKGNKLFTSDFVFQPSSNGLNVTQGTNSIKFTLPADNGIGQIEYVYTLKSDDYLIDFSVNIDGLERTIDPTNANNLSLIWNQKPQSVEKCLSIERQSASIFYHSQEDGYDWLNERGNDDDVAEFKTDWISFKQQFFSNILIAKGEAFSKPFMEIKYNDEDTTYLKKYSALIPLEWNPSKDNRYDFAMYFGPNDYNVLASIEDGSLELEDQINLGWGIFRAVNKYVLYPLFQLILEYLGVSIGIGIILLTFAIKLLLFPITYKNYLSSAKMRVIKPQLEKLNEENKDADPMKKQQATMALYKQTGVNPLAGCIPALLQMPILIALYRLFPASIELRHKGFLWADDLSSVDDYINLGFSIPLYGDHVSIFTLLMAISMFFYMRFNNQMTPSQSGGGEMQEAIQKNMKVMMNLMPLFMLFMFNNYAAGLSFYYFLANTITIGQTLTIKKFIIDEKAILAKIENQMKQPMKKSRWQKKIEEIQSKQQGKR